MSYASDFITTAKREFRYLARREFDELQENTVGILLVLPLVATLVALYLYPTVQAIIYSLQDISIFLGDSEVVGLANYIDLLRSGTFYNALWNGIIYTAGSVFLTVVIGVATGLLLNRTFTGERIATGLILVPYMVPTVAAVILFRWMLDGLYGVGNYALVVSTLIDEPIAWLASTRYAMPALILISGWRLYPFVTMLVLAKLQTIPKSYYESARLMGASRWEMFRHITLPQLRGVLFVAILLRLVWTFNLFDIIWLGTQGGPGNATETLPIMAYRLTFIGNDLGEGASVAVVTFLVLAVIVYGYFRLYGTTEEPR
ncbi:carbohydrate ABC transporter permease [Natrialba sp. SSL1]|uniref:carbohydrate ABC transporter permease n=1 Tax=Natrialba sp. SSL1 TaxID=1869245 RepID=UPI0008F87411|nr:sugar ABC transporter permease [Natrialba sp. SSL1]OIB59044.1 ABC transporter permease [Natrialba sp. SSL1]